LAAAYRDDAALEAMLPGRRIHCDNATDIAAALAAWWPAPADIVECSVEVVTGVDAGWVAIERVSPDGTGATRLNHAVRLVDGRISRDPVVCEPPQHVPAPTFAVPLEGVRARRSGSGGASGSVVEFVETDAGQFVVKHSSRSRDWVMRATGDSGREAMLFRS